jgi:lipopolysaccharide biosynthesis glycosyltransferase
MGFDGHYAMPAAVTLRSLGGSLRSGETATIHVLAVEIDNEDRGRIERSLAPSLDIRWYEFDVDHISGLPISSMSDEVYITRTAYTLLFLDRYLPSEIDRVLFLDADTLVRRSPAGLFGIDLGGCALGAVQDFGCPAIGLPKGVAGWRELGLDGRLPAFNTGFLLIDRPVWRETQVETRSVDYLARFGSRIHYVDQDCLNATNAGNWHHLPLTWNYQAVLEWSFGGDLAPAYAFLERHELDEARRDPSMVHYNGELKPWLTMGSKLPYLDEWRAAQDQTVWSGTPPTAPTRAPAWKVIRYRARKVGKALAGR